MFEQRVSTGEQESVKVSKPQKLLTYLPLIYPGTNCGDFPGRPQLIQRAVSTLVKELAHTRIRGLLTALRKGAYVMDQQDICPLNAQPRQAFFIRAHHAVIAIVKLNTFLRNVDESLRCDLVRGAVQEQPTDLG